MELDTGYQYEEYERSWLLCLRENSNIKVSTEAGLAKLMLIITQTYISRVKHELM